MPPGRADDNPAGKARRGREDRILEVLRSLTPPGPGSTAPASAPAAAGRRTPVPDSDPRSRERAVNTVREGADERPPAGAPARGSRIELGIEEAGVFFLAAALLLVIAFLMGWHARGAWAPGPAPRPAQGAPGDSPAAGGGGRAAIPLDSLPASLDLGERPSRGAPSRGPAVYAILAGRFPPGGEPEAEDHRKFLEERGYAPAFVRRTSEGLDLCVGRFESAADPLAREWVPRLKALREAYARSQVIRLP